MLVEEHGDLPSDELRERMLREVEAFVGDAPQHDDMTMILRRRVEAPSPVEPRGRAIRAAGAGMNEPGRHLPHALRRRGQRRPRAARGPRHPVAGLAPTACGPSVPSSPVNALGDIAVAVPAERSPTRRGGSSTATAMTAGAGRRRAGCATSSRRSRARIGYRFRDRGLLEHALTHTLARERGRQRRRRRQRVARVPRRRGARLRRSPTRCSASSRSSTKGRSRRSRRRWSRPAAGAAGRAPAASAITCCSGAARRRPAAAASRRCSPTATRR